MKQNHGLLNLNNKYSFKVITHNLLILSYKINTILLIPIIINGYSVTKYKRANNTLLMYNIGSTPAQTIKIVAIIINTKSKFSFIVCLFHLN